MRYSLRTLLLVLVFAPLGLALVVDFIDFWRRLGNEPISRPASEIIREPGEESPGLGVLSK